MLDLLCSYEMKRISSIVENSVNVHHSNSLLFKKIQQHIFGKQFAFLLNHSDLFSHNHISTLFLLYEMLKMLSREAL